MKRKVLFPAIIFIACAAVHLTSGAAPVSEADTVSRIFYGTDRSRRDTSKPSRFYGSKRGALNVGQLQLVRRDSGEKLTIDRVIPLPVESFLMKIRESVQGSKSSAILVFVHGYKRTFNSAGRLVAEFSAGIEFEGVTVMWSWPSGSNPAGYMEDETNMRWSYPHMAGFLRNIIEQSGAETVHLVGHSMGAKGLTEVMLMKLVAGGLDLGKIGEFILLAPDIDAGIFKRDIAPRLIKSGVATTLYVSDNDKAMASAFGVRGYPRLGDSRKGVTVISGIDTIDVTAANESILGHSYFKKSDEVTIDLAELLNKRTPASQRENLKFIGQGKIGHWQLQKNPD